VNPDGTLTATIDPTINSLVQTKVWSTDEAADMIAIDLTGMTLTGAQTWLWLSRTGGAAVESGDAYYAGPIALDAITTVTVDFMNITDPYSGKTFWVGNNMIIGMIPTPKILPIGTDYWVKITDVAPASSIPSSDVAVSNNKWKPIETVSIAPTTGPAGTLIQVSGIALTPSTLVNVTFSAGPTDTTPLMTQVSTNENGTFTTSFYATDLLITDTVTVTDYVNVVYAAGTLATSTSFDELGRVWLRVASTAGPSGNDFVAGDVSTLSDMVLAGNSFNPRGNLTLYWDWGLSGQAVLGIVSPNATGYFNATVVVPIASLGTHKVSAVDYSYNLNATVNVIPTFVLSPTSGPIGTVVTATGYGFPASTSSTVYNVTLTWIGYSSPVVASALTASNGQFTATFTVPHDFGGDHSVVALANDSVPTTATATFTVNPTLIITPVSSANNGNTITATGSGLVSGGAYSANIDNRYLFASNDGDYDTPIYANATGDLVVDFIAAGFEPGLHAFSIYPTNPVSPYKPTASKLFNITTVGSPLFDKINSLNSTIMSKLNPVIASIVGDIATIKTDLGTVKGTVTTIQGNVATIKTDLGVVKGNVPVDMTPAWIAVGLSLVAAIAAAIAAVGIFRKMA